MTPPCQSSPKTLRASLLIALLIAALNPGVYATVGRDWTLRTPLPSVETIQSMTSNSAGTRLVAVGNFGEIWTSDNATAWTKRTSGTTSNLLDVIFVGTQFVVVGDNSVVLRSADGIAWTQSAALGSQSLSSIAHNGDFFVACGWDGKAGVAQTSADAITWKQANPAAVVNPIDDVTHLGRFLFAVTSKNILKGSFTGANLIWTKVTGLTGVTANDAPVSLSTSTDTLVLSTSSNTDSKLWTSTGGVNWVERRVTTSSLRVQRIGGSNEMMGVGAAGEVWTSPNGTAWTDRSTGDPTDLFGGGKLGTTYVTTGAAGRILSIAPPGETVWTQRLSTADTLPISDVASNGTAFVTVSENASRTSTDGTTWTSRSQAGLLMASVTHTSSQYVAAGDGAWTSPDGITWTEALTPDDFTLYSVRKTGGQVVAVGFDTGDDLPVIYTSATGATWTRKTLPTAPADLGSSLYGVSAVGGLVVAVGDLGLVYRSIDGGNNWTKLVVAVGNSEAFLDVTFGGNLFTAVTSGGAIWTSQNGSTWTRRRASTGTALNRVLVVGNQFFAVGDDGTTAYSFGGLVWQGGQAGTAQSLYGLAWNGITLITGGDAGVILSSTGGQPARPSVSFAAATSAPSESIVGGIQQVQVDLSPASALPVTVLFTLSGSATQGASAVTSDYKVATTPITFAPNETSKLIPVTIFSDKQDELGETAVFSLGAPTGDAGLGATKVHTLTIVDDDQIPLFTTQPTTQLVTVGSALSLTSTAQGSPTLTGNWKKNNAAASGLTFVTNSMPPNATFNATAASAALTHAGAYNVEAKNDAGKTLSNIAYVGVVDNTSSTLVMPAGATMILNVKAAGTGLTYRWVKTGEGDLSNSTLDGISGATSTKLTIKDMGPTDSGTYFCRVTMNLPNGTTASQNAATTLAAVETSAPIVTTASLPTATVAEPYDFAPAAAFSPNKWTITGLPPGLTYNTSTGRITGKSTVSGTMGVTLKAANVVGEGLGSTINLTISALPTGSTGTFFGLADRNVVLNKNLGGRLKIDTTANGLYTGTLTQGKVVTNLSGALTFVPGGTPKLTGTHAIPINAAAAMPAATLSFELTPSTNAIIASTTNGSETATITTWANTWVSSPPTTRTGLYNFVIKPLTLAAATGKPQGHSIGTFTIANDGTLTVTGRTAENTVFTTTGTLSPNGEVAVYAELYNNNTGSLHGLMTVVVAGAGNTDNKITGNLTWSKTAQPAAPVTYSYRSGFDTMTLATDGSRYTPVGSAERYLLVPLATNPNIKVLFTRLIPDNASNNGNSVIDPDVSFQVFSPGTLPLVPSTIGSNPGATTVVINNDTGFANGTFTCVDLDPTKTNSSTVTRVATWHGLAIRPVGTTPMKSFGFYVVRELPTDDFPSPTTIATSPIVSGDLVIQRF